MCVEALVLPHEPGGDPLQPADMPEAVSAEDKLAKRILSGLGFCGHYMHFHGGGVSGKAPIICLLAKQPGGEMSQQELGMHFDLKPGSLSEILSKLKSGMRLQGTVSSIVDFGAFVDLGGIDGLIHISELSWNHVNHPSEVVKVGQEVEVEVLDVDLNRERISLGLKQTTEDPWRALVKKYPVGAIVEGTVTKLVPFGAFVDLGEGIEGLVHISEMANKHVDQPSQVTHVGDKVQVKVMEIDLDRRRISLSMKSAAETLGVEIEVTPLPSEKKDEETDAE